LSEWLSWQLLIPLDIGKDAERLAVYTEQQGINREYGGPYGWDTMVGGWPVSVFVLTVQVSEFR
jgi:hypothetical protein